MFYALVRLKAFRQLRKEHSLRETRNLLDAATDEIIDAAAVKAQTTIPAEFVEDEYGPQNVGAIGDGTIIQAIIDFLKSPAGQALIQALIALLIGFLHPAPAEA